MKDSAYTFIDTFRVDSGIYELYKSESGQFKTIKTIQGSYVPEEEIYDDIDELLAVFSNKISKKEILDLVQ